MADGLRWGVEPLCAVLTDHDIKISPSTYYEWVSKKPSRQQLRDDAVVELIRSERARTPVRPFCVEARIAQDVDPVAGQRSRRGPLHR